MIDQKEVSAYLPFGEYREHSGRSEAITFTADLFPTLPQTVYCHEISGVIRQRYASFGLMDNVVLNMSRQGAFNLGQWMIGCLFSNDYARYSMLVNETKGNLREVRVDLPRTRNLIDSLVEFTWNQKIPPEGVRSDVFDFSPMAFHVTNPNDEWVSINEFYERDVLAFSGGIRGITRAAEMLLYFGTDTDGVNYETFHHLAEPPFIATEDSCELRVEGDWVLRDSEQS